MAYMYESQVELYTAMETLYTNMKKDGKERKAIINYFTRKLEILESYWSEYQSNHKILSLMEDKDLPYFQEQHWEEAERLYQKIKEYISKSMETLRSKSSCQDEQTPGTSANYHAPKDQPHKTESSGSLSANYQEQSGGKKSQGSNSKTDEMLHMQKINFKAFMRTVNTINLENIAEKWEFEDLLSQLQDRWKVIDAQHWKIQAEQDDENVEYEKAFTYHENIYITFKKNINSKLWSVSHREKVTPKVDIPIFMGNYHQWVSFKDLFKEAVHLNPALSKAQKMQFLKSKVKGEAERLIQHLPISTDNYDTCWEILNHRYNNKKLIFSSHINMMMNLPTANHQSFVHIRRMHDVTLETLNAIKNLGDRLTQILIHEAHQLTFHGGPRLTLSNLRKNYWVIGGNRATKKELRNCIICRKNNPEIRYQLMGDLPESRTDPAPPFYHTGVDYTGFVDVKANKGRGIKTTKGYIVVFICMVTKAVHLEIVSDLTSEAFLSALRRMAARKSAPHHIYSDCGSNFIKANRIIREEYQELEKVFNDQFYQEITSMNITWHFNAPSWPSAGGLWERAVRSLKYHLKRTIGEQKLTFEEYSTLLAQIEACLNSRPLCSISEDVEDLDFLTPAHFLSDRADLTIIETDHDARTRWHLINKLKQDIWKRWKTEYLSQLSARSKWFKRQENIKIGDVVLIKEDQLPAGKWAMGRVTEVHPGHDGIIRVVTLKTKNGYFKRPVAKLSILPLQSTKEESSVYQEEKEDKD